MNYYCSIICTPHISIIFLLFTAPSLSRPDTLSLCSSSGNAPPPPPFPALPLSLLVQSVARAMTASSNQLVHGLTLSVPPLDILPWAFSPLLFTNPVSSISPNSCFSVYDCDCENLPLFRLCYCRSSFLVADFCSGFRYQTERQIHKQVDGVWCEGWMNFLEKPSVKRNQFC